MGLCANVIVSRALLTCLVRLKMDDPRGATFSGKYIGEIADLIDPVAWTR